MPHFPEPRSTFVGTGTHRLHVAHWGDPKAPAIILQHGLRDHARSWDWIAQPLAAISCPVLLAYGELSWIPVPPAKRLAKLRDHRVVMFPRASHWLHHQARADFERELNSFLHSSLESPFHA